MKKAVIIGAGPSGFAAAISCAQLLGKYPGEWEILLLERQSKPGRKLLATGNGRCNLSNLHIEPADYTSASYRQLEAVLGHLPVKRIRGFMEDHGLMCDVEDDRIYPYSYSAATVLEVLKSEAERLGVVLRCDCSVTEVQKKGDSFELLYGEGETLKAQAVLIACGGKASPRLGGNEQGYTLAEALGHSCTALWPCLVPFVSSSSLCKLLKGQRANGTLSLFQNGRHIASDTGEIQFTETGISGIPAFQLSRYYAEGDAELQVDLFPNVPEKRLLEMLRNRLRSGMNGEQLLLGTVHWKLVLAVLKAAGIDEAAEVRESQIPKIAAVCKALSFPVSGVGDWQQCQVTAGGIPLREVDTETMQSLKCPGLYLTGELLDAAGKCGGYNLHWAFGTGILAGEAMAKSLMPESTEAKNNPARPKTQRTPKEKHITHGPRRKKNK